jgi:hypothetical protein
MMQAADLVAWGYPYTLSRIRIVNYQTHEYQEFASF